MSLLTDLSTQRWFSAVQAGNIGVVWEMLDTHAGVTTHDGVTALMVACKADNAELAGLLIAAEKDLHTDRGKDALIYAAEYGSCKCIALLLSYTEIKRTTAGLTALDIALQRSDIASLRILLRHPRLTLDNVQYAYDNMPSSTPQHIQQLVLAALKSRGVHCKLKVSEYTDEAYDDEQGPLTSRTEATNPENGLELSQTPSTSILDASNGDVRHVKQTPQLQPVLEDDGAHSMSFLHDIPVVSSESNSSVSPCDQTNTNKNSRSNTSTTTDTDRTNTLGFRRTIGSPSIEMQVMKVQRCCTCVQTTHMVFTEADMAAKDEEIATLSADLYNFRKESARQGEIFMMQISKLEEEKEALHRKHIAKVLALEREVQSLKANNATLGEEIAALCASAATETTSTLIAAAQQLVKSELPPIQTVVESHLDTAASNDMLMRRSVHELSEASIDLERVFNVGSPQHKAQQTELLDSLSLDVARKDERIAALEQENKTLKNMVQNHETSISMYNNVVEALIRSPRLSDAGQATPEEALRNKSGIAISQHSVVNRQSSPSRSGMQRTTSVNSANRNVRGIGIRKDAITPSSVSNIKRSERMPTHSCSPRQQPSYTSTSVHTSARLSPSPTVRSPQPRTRTPQSSMSNARSPKLISLQPISNPRITADHIPITATAHRENLNSPHTDEWIRIAKKNRDLSQKCSIHTPLMDAVLSRRNQEIHKQLEYAGCALTNGYTALMFACERDNRYAVSILAPLEAGMALPNGDTALTLALKNEYFELAELLRGLEPSQYNVQSTSPQTQVLRKQLLSKNTHTDMMRHAIEGSVFRIFDLLPYQSRERDEHGNTALIYAATNDRPAAVKLLCTTEAGLYNKDGETALMRAAKSNNLNCCRLLVDHEKRRQDNLGYTALMRTAITGNAAMVNFLAPYESGMQNEHDDNCTALMYAVEYRNVECSEILAPREKTLVDTRGLTALERLTQRSGRANAHLQNTFMRILS